VTDEKKSLFERYGPVVVSLAALVTTLFFQHQRSVALALIALAFAALGMSAFPWFLRKVRERRVSRREKQVVNVAMSEIARHIRKFAQLTNLQTTDSIDYIVLGNLCGRNDDLYNSLHVVVPNIFDELCGQLNRRVAERGARYEELRATVDEFNYLISSFCRYLICPIYERVPTRLTPDVRVRYTQQIEDELIQYRERFTSFKDAYSDFLRELEEKLPRPLGLGSYFQGPKPLKSVTGPKTIAQL
jgi:hypothetical protein